LDFVAFTVNLLALNQFDIFERSWFIFCVIVGKVGLAKTKQVSSAKRRGLQLTQKGKSFTYIRKNNGPSVEP